ncbi:MAG: hypothetical protein ACI85Q_000405 [Salibacteraceae bacterium]
MEQQLEKIHFGIKQLQDLHQNALVEIDRLKAENSLLNQKILRYEESSASETEKKLLEGMTNNSASTEVEKKKMKLKINELVREVDKCIALLNQ